MTFQSIPLFCQFLCNERERVPQIIFSHGQFMRKMEKYIRENPNITEGSEGCTLTARYIFLGIPKVVNALLVQEKIEPNKTLKTKLVDMNEYFTGVGNNMIQTQVTGQFKKAMKTHFQEGNHHHGPFDWEETAETTQGTGETVAKYVAGNGAVLELTLTPSDGGGQKFYLVRHMYSLANHYQETSWVTGVSMKQIMAKDSILHAASVCDENIGVQFWWEVLQQALKDQAGFVFVTNMTEARALGVSALRRTWESAYLAKAAADQRKLRRELELQSETPVCFNDYTRDEDSSQLVLVQIPFVREVSTKGWDLSNQLASLPDLDIKDVCANGYTQDYTNSRKTKRSPCEGDHINAWKKKESTGSTRCSVM